jgi:hypothetical protein
MGKAGHFVSGAVDLLTLGAVGSISATVGAIVLFNIASTAPADPMWQEVRCWSGLSFQGDGDCFKKRLNDGLSKMESLYEQQKQQREQEFHQKERELDATIKKRTEELAALDQRRQTLEGEKAQIIQARSDLEGQIKKLEEIERASTSFNLFSEKSWTRGLKVTTGIEYKSFVQSQDWTKAWCYVQFEMENGVRAQLDLGRRFPDGTVSAGTVNSSVLEAGNFTASDVEGARALCAFPAAGS